MTWGGRLLLTRKMAHIRSKMWMKKWNKKWKQQQQKKEQRLKVRKVLSVTEKKTKLQ